MKVINLNKVKSDKELERSYIKLLASKYELKGVKK